MKFEESRSKIVEILRKGKNFLLTTHKDPDGDGIGSMLALGSVLRNAGKKVVLVTNEPVPSPFDELQGADMISENFNDADGFDGVIILDCAEKSRLGGLLKRLEPLRPWINIDHHETNDLFGDLNLIDGHSSSTGELVYGIIKECGYPITYDVAENLFAAIQTDTGSFKYDNTTSSAFRAAAELVDKGASPWEISKKLVDSHDLSRLKLLEMALGTIEIHHGGKIALMVLSKEMFDRAGADRMDSERFVDYARFIRGVEIAALIRQTGHNEYKFSLRSNNYVNVAQLAGSFGGGGHAKAAGFDCKGNIDRLKRTFIDEAIRFLDGRQS